MSDSAPSPTPSEDNRKNVRDDLMQNALENFMSRAPQSYDDFVDSFSTLKQCKPALVPSLAERKLAGHTPAPTGLTDQTEPSDDGPVKSTRNIVNDIKRRRLGKVIVGRKPEEDKGEEIEEQVLSEGNVSCRLGKSNVIRTGAVKANDVVTRKNKLA
ncbi:hypothetical protein MAR_009522 [Mya arenaria]|uniref:Uncharacterized protein n=1 Tax=Mya arenaria TaxID=6604 RepID=A0ABY7E153_MYAAR|nr:hypothetical protein MAR_009522 [Mya arenaria]